MVPRDYAKFIMAAAALAVCACGLFAVPAEAGEGTTSGTFLKLAPGPRAVGMGEAYTAVAEDAYSAWWNPAGLASLELPEIGATHNASFQSVSHQYVSFSYPLRYGSVIGVSVTRLSVAPFQGYDASGYKTSKVDAADTAFAGTYSRTLTKDEIERPVLSVGASLKGISSRLDNVTANAAAVDLGAIYYMRPAGYWTRKAPGQEFRFAFALRNLGTGLKYDKVSFPLPLSATLGAAWVSHPWGMHRLTVALDQTIFSDEGYTAALGADYLMFQMLSFRAGFKSGQDMGSGLRTGIGFRLASFDLDYSMSPFGELGSMHRFGISMRFGAPKPSMAARAGRTRVASAKMVASREQIEKLQNYADDYLKLARRDLASSRYVSAQANIDKAFNLEPQLNDGAWGDRSERLDKVSSSLRLKETPERERTLQQDGEQAGVAHEAVMAYLEGHELKAFLLAHAALGADIRGDSVFEDLLYLFGELSHDNVRRDEILPRAALVKEKLKKAARYFYMQQFDMAARECEEVTLLDEGNPLGWTRLGSAYYMMGEKEKARAAYRKALELNPGDPVVAKFMEAQGWN